jgi:hypothetical protein
MFGMVLVTHPVGVVTKVAPEVAFKPNPHSPTPADPLDYSRNVGRNFSLAFWHSQSQGTIKEGLRTFYILRWRTWCRSCMSTYLQSYILYQTLQLIRKALVFRD